ncbi:MAG: HNH endonuclease [Promethearchaeota archaeon]
MKRNEKGQFISDNKKKSTRCNNCNDEFEYYPTESNGKFCSKKCYGKSKEDKVEVECEYCDDVFKITSKKSEKRRFCSAECHKNYIKKHRNEVECHQCGEKFSRKPYSVKRSNKNFCSMECKNKYQSYIMSGERNPNWNGGYEPYYGANWIDVKKKIKERDRDKCCICGDDNILHIHHIIPMRFYQSRKNFDDEWYLKANDESNLITLCNSCHRSVHNSDSHPLLYEV